MSDKILNEYQYHLFCKCKKNGKLFIQVHSFGCEEEKNRDFGKCNVCNTNFKIYKKVKIKIDVDKDKIIPKDEVTIINEC